MNTYKQNTSTAQISPLRIFRIKEQGYDTGFTQEEISKHAAGNRFAYQMCTILFTMGLVLTNIPILTIAAIIAGLAVILPNHPFDYLYNFSLRQWLKKPKLPPRSAQAKFACGIAAVWLGTIIYLFYASLYVLGYTMGGILFVIAFLVSTIDLCIPSKIYNALFLRKKISG
jgi:hypothetical protein